MINKTGSSKERGNLTMSYLNAELTIDEIKGYIENIDLNALHGILVSLYHLNQVRQLLGDTGVQLATVVAYPLGCLTTKTKIEQLRYAVEMNATEIYYQLNYNALKTADWDYVNGEIQSINSFRREGIKIIPILETKLMNAAEKLRIYQIVVKNNLKYVQLGSRIVGPATNEDISEFVNHYSVNIERVGIYNQRLACTGKAGIWSEFLIR